MSELTLTKTIIKAGAWNGVLTGAGDTAPALRLMLDGEEVGQCALDRREEGGWYVRAPIPDETIADGVQTFVIADGEGAALASFVLMTDDALGDDLRAEVDLLRAELDLLKRAFRRHCVETA